MLEGVKDGTRHHRPSSWPFGMCFYVLVWPPDSIPFMISLWDVSGSKQKGQLVPTDDVYAMCILLLFMCTFV